jgi:hypothetical protein
MCKEGENDVDYRKIIVRGKRTKRRMETEEKQNF